MVQNGDFAFDCYQSQWAKSNAGRLGALSNLRSLGTNSECGFVIEQIRWTVFPEVVNGTLRCELDDIVGEYTVAVFKDKRTSYGDYFCSSAHFPVTEEYPVGSVADTIQTPN